MKRKPYIAGNWKMNCTNDKAAILADELKEKLDGISGIDIGVFPPFTALSSVAENLKNTNIIVGAQNMGQYESGAYTGEISGDMILSTGSTSVILGHSERRGYYFENDEMINSKLKAALLKGLNPIVCVGELLEEKEKGLLKSVLRRQISKALDGISKQDISKVVFAYEPVWAIGTGKNATSSDAEEGCQFIRTVIGDIFHPTRAMESRILYGGSVKSANISEYRSLENVDGALVGGASLKADEFSKIIKGWLES